MARKRSVLDDGGVTRETDRIGTTARKNRLLSRRGYLRSTGAAVATLAGLSTIGTTVGNEDYEVIEARGQGITIESGETWENKLIDCSTGQRIRIVATGTDWTIRNVGFEGMIQDDDSYAVFGVGDTAGGESTIENVYMADGSVAGNALRVTAFWVSHQHSGHLNVRNVNVQGFSDNAIYASAAVRSGGTTHVDGCYAANNRISAYRLATPGDRVTNSAVVFDQNGYDGRGVWAWSPGPITVEDCEILTRGRGPGIRAGAHTGGTTVQVINSNVDETTTSHGSTIEMDDQSGTDPSPGEPADYGCPTSAEAAALGDSDDTTGSQNPGHWNDTRVY